MENANLFAVRHEDVSRKQHEVLRPDVRMRNVASVWRASVMSKAEGLRIQRMFDEAEEIVSGSLFPIIKYGLVAQPVRAHA